MKKVLALLIMLVLLLGTVSEALGADEEITFQGIPWGSDHAEVTKLLIEKGFLNGKEKSPKEKDGDVLFTWKGKNPVRRSAGEGWYGYNDYDEWISAASYTDSGKEIAGYPLKELVLSYFQNNGKSQLVCVSFTVDAPNGDEAYDDLLAKLTQVYGKGEEFTDPTYKVADWKGSNGTAIYLEHYITPGTQTDVTVYYGWTDSEELFKEVFVPEDDPHNNVEATTEGL